MLPYCQDHYRDEAEAESTTNVPKLLQHRGGPPTLDEAIKGSQDFLLSLQFPEGYWWAQLEGNVAITAETVFLYKILGIDGKYPMHKMKNYLRECQLSNGGWELCHGDGGHLSMTIEAYMALCLLNVSTAEPSMQKAREFVISKGGVTKSRIFTKLCLAMLGCYDWSGIPSLPPWIMLLPNWFITNIYEMASWARSATIPLIIFCDKKPVFEVDPPLNLDDFYVEGRKNARFTPPFQGDWSDFFIVADKALKLAEKLNLVPFRERGLKEALKWVVERQEDTGDWAGIYIPMFYSILCMKLVGYGVSDPVLHRGLKAVEAFSVETHDKLWVQACVSPVWDTALVMRSLVESGIPRDHPALQRGGAWLLHKQVTQHGDWAVKNTAGHTGAWAFEFWNRWYPDVDDTAVVVMALNAIRLPENDSLRQAAIARAVKWVNSMQCKTGGWAAFDKDNDQNWWNCTPYGDMKGMIDPNTSDVTARVLEMVGRMSTTTMHSDNNYEKSLLPPPESISAALQYLRKEQEEEGCWWGRWGVNYIYGTCGVMVALALVAPTTHQKEISRGAKWLVQVQNKSNHIGDGGWGETCDSYVDPSLKGQGDSTPSQTAWALMGLLAAGDALGKYEVEAIEAGISYLVSTQRKDGSWFEASFTGTGFPGHFYLRYHLYAQHFVLTALGRYRSRLRKNADDHLV